MHQDELLSGLKSADEKACTFFINSYKEMVYKIAISFVSSPEDAEELTQDVFVKAIRQIEKFKQQSSLKTWLYRITVNEALNKTRSAKSRFFSSLFARNNPSVADTISIVEQSPESKKISHENLQFLYRCIECLPEQQKIAFTLNKIDELPYAEVAEIMGISVSSVESLLHRAKKKLQSEIVKNS
jgi:RNA polymerase sigma-70 factor (ECF subfamily)